VFIVCRGTEDHPDHFTLRVSLYVCAGADEDECLGNLSVKNKAGTRFTVIRLDG